MTRAGRAAALEPAGAAFHVLKKRIIERTGHHYYADKDDQLRERVDARMHAHGLSDPAAYLALLDDGMAGTDEWRALESAITINETFFFRFAEQFDVLRSHVLPDLLRVRASERRLRIWSVGCSTGAEPYSLAILIGDLLGDAAADWHVDILGTDIDADALATARAASYSHWALRTVDDVERQRLFLRERDRYVLRERYRRGVRFERHNMLALLDPEADPRLSRYDLILCRNVLIYFRLDQASAMMTALALRLAETGYLFVGHAEPNPMFDRAARAVEIDGILAYRRRDTAPDAAVPTAPVPTAPEARGIQRPPAPLRRIAPARPRRQPEAAAPPPSPAIGDVRTMLSIGDPAQALAAAEREALAAPIDPVPHYLVALGALALGDGARAEKGFRNALYLDNGFVMAHYLLGRHLVATDRIAEGQRALRNAARLAAALPEDAELVEGDGMTAGMLAAAARHALADAA